MKKKIVGMFVCMLLIIPVLSTTVSAGPELEIVDVKGGWGIRTYIKNIGNETPNKVYFTLEHDGGIFVRLRKHGTAIDPIAPGETDVFWIGPGRYGISLGILTEPSWFKITIDVNQDIVTDVVTFNALVFGPFVFIQ